MIYGTLWFGSKATPETRYQECSGGVHLHVVPPLLTRVCRMMLPPKASNHAISETRIRSLQKQSQESINPTKTVSRVPRHTGNLPESQTINRSSTDTKQRALPFSPSHSTLPENKHGSRSSACSPSGVISVDDRCSHACDASHKPLSAQCSRKYAGSPFSKLTGSFNTTADYA